MRRPPIAASLCAPLTTSEIIYPPMPPLEEQAVFFTLFYRPTIPTSRPLLVRHTFTPMTLNGTNFPLRPSAPRSLAIVMTDPAIGSKPRHWPPRPHCPRRLRRKHPCTFGPSLSCCRRGPLSTPRYIHDPNQQPFCSFIFPSRRR
jgi:hypothetical protein